jgi:hypothetical protein
VEEYVRRYWMAVKKRDDTGNRNKKQQIAVYEVLALEEEMELP